MWQGRTGDRPPYADYWNAALFRALGTKFSQIEAETVFSAHSLRLWIRFDILL